MASKADVKGEVKKLKRVADRSEEWASKATSFIQITQELCKFALVECSHGDKEANDIYQVILLGWEVVNKAILRVVELAKSRSSEVSNDFGLKNGRFSRSKGSQYTLPELKARAENACSAISMAIFDALTVLSEELEKVAAHSMTVTRRSTAQSTANLPPSTPPAQFRTSNDVQSMWEECEDMCKSTPAGDDLNLDWDAFDADLKAMSAVVQQCDGSDSLFSSTPTDVISAGDALAMLRAQVKESQMEKDNALQRALKAESELQDMRRRHECVVRSCSTSYTDDDYIEIKLALKREQIARLEMERQCYIAKREADRAQEEMRASRFALQVAQEVACRVADDFDNVTQESTLLRRTSASSDHAVYKDSSTETTQGVDYGARNLKGSVSMSGLRDLSTVEDVDDRSNAVGVSGDGLKDDCVDKNVEEESNGLVCEGVNPFLVSAGSTAGKTQGEEENPFLCGSESDSGVREVFGDERAVDKTSCTAEGKLGVGSEEVGGSVGENEHTDKERYGGTVVVQPTLEVGPKGPNPFLTEEASKKETMEVEHTDKEWYGGTSAVQPTLEVDLNTTNPFLTEEASKEESVEKTEDWNPFSPTKQGKGDVTCTELEADQPNQHGCDNKSQGDWNPFTMGGSQKEAADSVVEVDRVGDSAGGMDKGGNKSRDEWNPFAVSGSRVEAVVVQESGKDTEGSWNPFSVGQETVEDSGKGWNPFENARKAKEEGVGKNGDWNPFV